MITPLKLEQQLPTGRCPREAHRRHGRLGPAVHEAKHLDSRHARPHELAEFHLGLTWGPVGPARQGGALDGLPHGGMRVAEDERPPRSDVVQVTPAVDVGESGPIRAGDEERCAADRTKGPHG